MEGLVGHTGAERRESKVSRIKVPARVKAASGVLVVGLGLGLGFLVTGSGVANADICGQGSAWGPGGGAQGSICITGNRGPGWNQWRNDCGWKGCGPQWIVQELSDHWKPGHEEFWGSRGCVWVPWGPGQIVERNGTIFRVIW